MPMNSSSALARTAVAALLGMLLAGCATVEPRAPEDIVAERAQARWDALLAGKIKEAYPYYAPGYRSGVSLDSLRSQVTGSRVEWQDVELKEVECETDACQARFVVTYTFRSPTPRVGTVDAATWMEENWVRSDGTWFFVPSD